MGGIALIGLGKMGTALAEGVLATGYSPAQLIGYDISPEARQRFADTTGARVFDTPEAALNGANMVILCVKPQNLADTAERIKSHLSSMLVVSILAGMTLQRLADTLGTRRVVRVMPNLPVTVRAGVSCYVPDSGVTDDDLRTLERILSASGDALRVEEAWMDAITGLSGSGPAFVLEFLIGLAEGGVRQGLPLDTARRLAAATIAGTVKLLNDTGLPPETLRDNVISPNGTTAAGMKVLNDRGLAALAADAVDAAANRSAELGK